MLLRTFQCETGRYANSFRTIVQLQPGKGDFVRPLTLEFVLTWIESFANRGMDRSLDPLQSTYVKNAQVVSAENAILIIISGLT